LQLEGPTAKNDRAAAIWAALGFWSLPSATTKVSGGCKVVVCNLKVPHAADDIRRCKLGCVHPQLISLPIFPGFPPILRSIIFPRQPDFGPRSV